jgi:predicted acetyltransferase
MPLEFRAVPPDGLAEFTKTAGLAFGFDPNQETDGHYLEVLDPARTRCGFDENVMVSTSAAYSLDMTVPGGSVACGGTTVVTVAPTHRRQGVLRAMMRAHLDDVREHEEPIAALWASDSAIYGRFGYGSAAISYQIEVSREQIGFHRLAPAPPPVRLLDTPEARDLLPPFYESARLRIPGAFHRTAPWWEHRRLADPESARNGATAKRFVAVEGDDGIAGFAQYRFLSKWDGGHGAGKVMVQELQGTTPESWSGLWGYLLGHDLTAIIKAPNRPTWDPIFDLLAGERRARASRQDALWVRIMDIPAALGARRYSAPLDLVFGVDDPMGDTSGSYRLMARDDGAECRPTTDTPALEIDLEDLSACYLGRSRFAQLARSGRIRGDQASLAAADRAFTWSPEPWCPEIF